MEAQPCLLLLCHLCSLPPKLSHLALVVKNPPASAGDAGFISGRGRSPGGGPGYPLQHSCLENRVDRGAWKATVHGVARDLDVTEHAHTDCLCKISHLTSPPNLHSWKTPTPASVSRDSWSSFLVFELLFPQLVLVNMFYLPGDIFLF